jgi:hypothetical protein
MKPVWTTEELLDKCEMVINKIKKLIDLNFQKQHSIRVLKPHARVPDHRFVLIQTRKRIHHQMAKICL